MNNTIQIKHGSSISERGVLKPFELGYVTSTGTLVIGTSEEASDLKYLKLDTHGLLPRIDVGTSLKVYSSGTIPTIMLESEDKDIKFKGGFGVRSSDGRCMVLSYPSDTSYYEYYCFPTPLTGLTANQYQSILTSRGGSFPGDFTFTTGNITINKNLVVNGAIKVDSSSYGTKDPNSAGISGTAGQLYFVIAG